MVCDNCPLRLFNDKGYNLKGIGNSSYGNMAILPNIDKEAYKNNDISFSKQLDVINQILSKGEFQENFYITPLIKCKETTNCITTDIIIRNCQIHLMNEIKRCNPRHVILFGSSIRRLFNVNISIENVIGKIYVSPNNRIYYFNYSPFIVYKNIDKQSVFIEELLKAYYSITNKYYYEYEKLIL